MLYQATGRADLALARFQRALAIRRQSLPGAPATRATAGRLAALYRQSGRAGLAQQLEQELEQAQAQAQRRSPG